MSQYRGGPQRSRSRQGQGYKRPYPMEDNLHVTTFHEECPRPRDAGEMYERSYIPETHRTERGGASFSSSHGGRVSSWKSKQDREPFHMERVHASSSSWQDSPRGRSLHREVPSSPWSAEARHHGSDGTRSTMDPRDEAGHFAPVVAHEDRKMPTFPGPYGSDSGLSERALDPHHSRGRGFAGSRGDNAGAYRHDQGKPFTTTAWADRNDQRYPRPSGSDSSRTPYPQQSRHRESTSSCGSDSGGYRQEQREVFTSPAAQADRNMQRYPQPSGVDLEHSSRTPYPQQSRHRESAGSNGSDSSGYRREQREVFTSPSAQADRNMQRYPQPSGVDLGHSSRTPYPQQRRDRESTGSNGSDSSGYRREQRDAFTSPAAQADRNMQRYPQPSGIDVEHSSRSSYPQQSRGRGRGGSSRGASGGYRHDQGKLFTTAASQADRNMQRYPPPSGSDPEHLSRSPYSQQSRDRGRGGSYGGNVGSCRRDQRKPFTASHAECSRVGMDGKQESPKPSASRDPSSSRASSSEFEDPEQGLSQMERVLFDNLLKTDPGALGESKPQVLAALRDRLDQLKKQLGEQEGPGSSAAAGPSAADNQQKGKPGNGQSPGTKHYEYGHGSTYLPGKEEPLQHQHPLSSSSGASGNQDSKLGGLSAMPTQSEYGHGFPGPSGMPSPFQHQQPFPGSSGAISSAHGLHSMPSSLEGQQAGQGMDPLALPMRGRKRRQKRERQQQNQLPVSSRMEMQRLQQLPDSRKRKRQRSKRNRMQLQLPDSSTDLPPVAPPQTLPPEMPPSLPWQHDQQSEEFWPDEPLPGSADGGFWYSSNEVGENSKVDEATAPQPVARHGQVRSRPVAQQKLLDRLQVFKSNLAKFKKKTRTMTMTRAISSGPYIDSILVLKYVIQKAPQRLAHRQGLLYFEDIALAYAASPAFARLKLSLVTQAWEALMSKPPHQIVEDSYAIAAQLQLDPSFPQPTSLLIKTLGMPTNGPTKENWKVLYCLALKRSPRLDTATMITHTTGLQGNVCQEDF